MKSPVNPGISYMCAVCNQPITAADWRAEVLPDGKLQLTALHHGSEWQLHPQWLNLSGWVFYEGNMAPRLPFTSEARQGE